MYFVSMLEFIRFANICRKLIDIETNGNINTINCQIIGNFEDLDCWLDVYVHKDGKFSRNFQSLSSSRMIEVDGRTI